MSAPSQDADPRPERPDPPHPASCCGRGCAPCVYDIYDEQLERYRESLAAWEARNPGPLQR